MKTNDSGLKHGKKSKFYQSKIKLRASREPEIKPNKPKWR